MENYPPAFLRMFRGRYHPGGFEPRVSAFQARESLQCMARLWREASDITVRLVMGTWEMMADKHPIFSARTKHVNATHPQILVSHLSTQHPQPCTSLYPSSLLPSFPAVARPPGATSPANAMTPTPGFRLTG
jgi:hypothetical protein